MPVVYQFLPGPSDMNHFRLLRSAGMIVVDAVISKATSSRQHAAQRRRMGVGGEATPNERQGGRKNMRQSRG